ncbi:MAG: hypothetical protein ACYTG0_09100 [Planctomycetota bacterium]|jgi:hypothetical protein
MFSSDRHRRDSLPASDHADQRTGRGGRPRRRELAAWLAVEVLLGGYIIAIVAARNTFSDHDFVLPVGLVAMLVACVAAVMRCRWLFLFGTIGACIGAIFHPYLLRVTWDPGTEFAVRHVIRVRLDAEIKLRGAFKGGMIGLGIGAAFAATCHIVRRKGRGQFTLGWLLRLTAAVAVLLSSWKWYTSGSPVRCVFRLCPPPSDAER